MRPCVTGTALSFAVVLFVVAESRLLSGHWHPAQTVGTLVALAVGLVLLVLVRGAREHGGSTRRVLR